MAKSSKLPKYDPQAELLILELDFTLFKKHNIIDYIVSCYGALHIMGGLAITEDIDSLIKD